MPSNPDVAITMRFAASRRKPACIYARGPQIQETHRTTHTGTTTRCRTQRRNENDRNRTCRTQEVPFIAACSHFTLKNTRFRAPASSSTSVTTSLRHHFPRSPLPFVTTLCHSLLFFCDVLLCDVKSHTALHQCQVSQFYLSVTRSIASQLPLIIIRI